MVGVLAAGIAAAQDAIRMLPTLRHDGAAAIRLADVAKISGDNAAMLGALVLVEKDAAGVPSTIDVAFVRDVLKKNNVNLGAVLLSGVPCKVQGVGAPVAEAASAASEADAVMEPVAVNAAALAKADVRSAVAQKLADLYQVDADRVRLTFESGHDALLDGVTEGRTVTVQPAAAGKRIPVMIRVYSGEALDRSGTVRVGVEILRDVLIASAPIARGAPVEGAGLSLDTRWMTPDFKPAVYEETVGANAIARIEAGAVIESRMVRTPEVIAKGDICQVDCLSGGIVVQAQARAMEGAREGQTIRFQSMNSKKTFLARVSGAGRAVMVVR